MGAKSIHSEKTKNYIFKKINNDLTANSLSSKVKLTKAMLYQDLGIKLNENQIVSIYHRMRKEKEAKEQETIKAASERQR